MSCFSIYKSVDEWREAIEDSSLCGLFVDSDSRLFLDRRFTEESAAFMLVGPRTVDLNIIGSERIIVPGDVAISYITEAIRLRADVERKIEGSWSH